MSVLKSSQLQLRSPQTLLKRFLQHQTQNVRIQDQRVLSDQLGLTSFNWGTLTKRLDQI